MTFTRKSTTVKDYYIEITQDKYQSGYTVTACPVYYIDGECYVSYPTKKNYYGTKEQAARRFRDLVRTVERRGWI